MKHVQLRLEDDEYAAFMAKAREAGFTKFQQAGKAALKEIEWGAAGPGEAPARYARVQRTLVRLLQVCDDGTAEAAHKVLAALLNQCETGSSPVPRKRR